MYITVVNESTKLKINHLTCFNISANINYRQQAKAFVSNPYGATGDSVIPAGRTAPNTDFLEAPLIVLIKRQEEIKSCENGRKTPPHLAP